MTFPPRLEDDLDEIAAQIPRVPRAYSTLRSLLALLPSPIAARTQAAFPAGEVAQPEEAAQQMGVTEGVGTIPGSALMDGAIGAGQIRGGAVTGATFAATVRPVYLVSALPTLPDSLYPPGQFVLLTSASPPTMYENVADAWVKAIGAEDIKADSITAGVIAAGAIGTSELAVGARLTGEVANETGLTPGVFIDSTGILIRNGALTFQDAFGDTVMSGGGFGPAWRRFLTAGVYNSDFFGAPLTPANDIDDTTNPLPYWSLVKRSGTAINAKNIADADAGSGRIIEFTMAAGAAGDDTCLEQIIPINASRSRGFAYRARASFSAPSPTVTAKSYLEATWLEEDGTPIGTTGVKQFAIDGLVADTVWELSCAAGTADGNTGGQVPSNAYYLRIRVGLRRDTAAAGAADELQVHEVNLFTIPGELGIQDTTAPTNPPARFFKQSGVTYLLGRGTDASSTPLTPAVQLDDDEGGGGGTSIRLGATMVTASGFLGLGGSSWVVNGASSSLSPTLNRYGILNIGSDVTLTSTPTIASPPSGAGTGVLLLLHNTGTPTVTLQDQGTLAGSNLLLTTSAVTLAQYDSLLLMWDGSDWVEIGRSIAPVTTVVNPTISNAGTATFTTNELRYLVVGGVTFWTYELTINAAGSGGGTIGIALPGDVVGRSQVVVGMATGFTTFVNGICFGFQNVSTDEVSPRDVNGLALARAHFAAGANIRLTGFFQ